MIEGGRVSAAACMRLPFAKNDKNIHGQDSRGGYASSTSKKLANMNS